MCCGEQPSVVCDGCVPASKSGIIRRDRFQLAVGAELDECLSKLITAFKDGGQLALKTELAAIANLALDTCLQSFPSPSFDSTAAITWVPSSQSALRRRGFDANLLVLKHTMRLRKLQGLGALQLVSPLRHVGTARDQTALGRGARFENTEGRFKSSYRQEPLLLFDDIVTTGATFLAAAAALESAGCQVVAGFALAETPLLGSTQGASRII